MTDDEWHRVLRVNLDGCFYTCRIATQHMVDSGLGGSIVITASGSVASGQARGQHYGASKGGVVSMMRAIAVEHAARIAPTPSCRMDRDAMRARIRL